MRDRAGLISLLVATLLLAGTAARAEVTTLRYDVQHALYGDIGDYTNVIERDADNVTIHTELHLLVTILGIAVHREQAERTEHWVAGRLVGFHGVTTANDEVTEIDGHAVENGFEIRTGDQLILAPADICPSNPWSANLLSAKVMMRSDSGTVENVTVGAPKKVQVKIAGRSIATTLYEIDADPAYSVWLDDSQIPVMFAVKDESGLIRFILNS